MEPVISFRNEARPEGSVVCPVDFNAALGGSRADTAGKLLVRRDSEC
jgi:hypothetical protein